MKLFGVKAAWAICLFLSPSLFADNSVNQLELYCGDGSLEYQQTTRIGAGVRVVLNQDDRPYAFSALVTEISQNFIEKQLMYEAGVSSECAEFVMLKGGRVAAIDGTIARVNFSFDSSELSDRSRYILDKMLSGLKYSNKIVVEGHTDNVGEKSYNFTLGANRAVAIADYMSQHPNTPYNLIKVSKGETAPVADNSTEDGRYSNRRVDIKQ